ncbi:MAG: Holliday junction branch migration DNA helicase RuvB [bacterium]|uniref:Holliday junction branch migration complex subunit RuvB n=1 Tax=Candidatus Liptonbacteria bacterium RIFCSPLOWO2_01_FULL_45_15 TaxID=1798649 RepID=A0A1G2CCK3_9BACT|nr:Holliday junction branch migration DNA helicase RuvB [bacterium]OGY98956.1 MAG: Holliday junction DNA helicase RuvB [Candidatus Liptonbacteria bacterium RIFCSPLOWO2_01_FULL_45_15]
MNEINKEDITVDQALRPLRWEEYFGQDKIKKNLRIIIEAAQKRSEAMDHILLCGQAGLGKTTLAYLVGKEMGANVKTTSGPALEKLGDMAAILSNLEAGEVLFIDEAHRINRLIEEVLYPAMESRKLHLIVGKGPTARSFSIDLPPFTLIAATTRENLLSQPLRSRFGAIFRLDYYGLEDIKAILKRSAEILGVKMSPEAVEILSKASRATPRVVNRILRRARDYSEVHGQPVVDDKIAKKTLEFLDIDDAGLEPQDKRLLEVIINKFGGGPVGLGTLAAALNEDRGAIEDIYEPYLMTLGFLKRTSSGRLALPAAYEHLGLNRRGELL